MFKKVIFPFILLLVFVLNLSFPHNAFSAPITLEQVDVGDETVPLQVSYAAESNSYVLENGDGAFSASIPSVVGDQIYFYDHSTGFTTLVSVSSDEEEGDSDSGGPIISSDGNYVVFSSSATNLVPDDTNGAFDIFLRDIALGTTTRISVSSDEEEGDGGSHSASISSDNNYVVFSSSATNLVPDDTNGDADIFLRDIALGTTTRISVNSDEEEGDSDSGGPIISSDGNYVVFSSSATNLVPDDTNGAFDIFLRDIALGTTTRISVNSDEEEGDGGSYSPIISSDGNYVVFYSYATNLVADDTNGDADIFLRDIALGTTTRISVSSDEEEGDGGSYSPIISSDGNYVVFYSSATNLVADDTNGVEDIFLRDIALGTTTRVSVSSDEEEGNDYSSGFVPYVSADGNYVVFYSNATNLVADDTNGAPDIFLRDISLSTTTLISNYYTTESYDSESDAGYYNQNISEDNNLIVFASSATNLVADDNNGVHDVFSRDIALGTTTRVSLSSDEEEGNGSSSKPSISSDGNYVVFSSDASNLVANDINDVADVFLRDIALGTTTRISINSDEEEGGGGSYNPSISSDGNYVVFSSDASNLVANDTNGQSDIFLRDIALGTTTRISVSSDEEEGDNTSDSPLISADGNYVVFYSYATNLVADDTNGVEDIFLRDIALGTTTRISVNSDEEEGDNTSDSPLISADGNYVVFSSSATNLVPDDTNGDADIFLRDIALGTTTRISVNSDEEEGDGESYSASISSDGNYVVFYSDATNLVVGDTDGNSDIFLRDIALGTTTRISVNSSEEEGDGGSSNPSISSDGSFVAFTSYATNLIDGVTGPGGGNYFLARVLEEEELEPETPRITSSGSRAKSTRNNLLNNNTFPPNNSALTDCLPSYKFSPSTGFPCAEEISKFIFLNNLSLKMIHPDVKQLQKYLNTHGFPVALSGPGSLGFETEKFGLFTYYALIKFQLAKSITPPVGFFGPITRGVMNTQ